MTIETRAIRITVVVHRESDLMMAFSDDLQGLLVPGRTTAELEAKLEPSIREIVEAEGYHVLSIEVHADADSELPESFSPRRYIASAALQAA